MATQSAFYFTDGTTRTFPSTKHIATKQHVGVYLQRALDSAWETALSTSYELVNNSIVFDSAIDNVLYIQIEIRVVDTAAELVDSPSNIALVAASIADVSTVADSILDVNTVATNIGSVQNTSAINADISTVAGISTNVTTVAGVSTSIPTVAGISANVTTVAGVSGNVTTVANSIANVNTAAINIADINSVATIVVPNIAEILLADDNATVATAQAGIATTQATNASSSATQAQLSEWGAEAERLTADSYATEAEDTFVNLVTSDGDGTFTYTPTTDYSALHWAAKSMSGDIAPIIHAASSKTTPVDADEFAITDSAASFGLKKLTLANLKANLPTGKNYIINGGFDYWNYATSQTTTGYGSDDRWSNLHNGSTKTHSMVNATDTERALFGSSKFSRTVVTSVAGVDNYCVKVQAIENVTKLAGKTITISFWAKADSAKNIAIEMSQSFGTGGSTSADVRSIIAQHIALTSTWQKKTITVNIPSIVGKVLGTDGVHTSLTALRFWFESGSNRNTYTNSLGQQSGTFDIAEVKLEEGSVATPWTPYEGEFGGEVQACQRYYEKIDSLMVRNTGAASLEMRATWAFSTTKRVAPTVTAATGAPTGTSTTSVTLYQSSVASNTVYNTGACTAGAEL